MYAKNMYAVECERFMNREIRQILKKYPLKEGFDENGYRIQQINEQLIDLVNELDETFASYHVIANIPIGSFFPVAILENKGFSIPMKFRVIPSISSSVQTNVKPYGLLHALIEFDAEIVIDYEVICSLFLFQNQMRISFPIYLQITSFNM